MKKKSKAKPKASPAPPMNPAPDQPNPQEFDFDARVASELPKNVPNAVWSPFSTEMSCALVTIYERPVSMTWTSDGLLWTTRRRLFFTDRTGPYFTKDEAGAAAAREAEEANAEDGETREMRWVGSAPPGDPRSELALAVKL